MASLLSSVLNNNPILKAAGVDPSKGGMVGQILNPIMGVDTSSEDAAALAALQSGQAAYQNTALPGLSVPTPQNYTAAGIMSAPQGVSYDQSGPQYASVYQQDPSSYNDIQTDPRLMNDQMSAISALQDVAKQGGLTDADKANLANIQSTEAQADKGRRDAILQQMGAQGMSSSGNGLLAQLQSSQAATDRQSQQDLGVAGQAQQNALNATLNSGNLANQVGQTQFNQQAQIAAANDAINRFNSGNLNQASATNASTANQNALQQAQGNMSANEFNNGQAYNTNLYNAGLLQSISNQNTQAKNQAAQQAAYDLPQQQFQNQMSKDAGISGQANSLSNYYTGLGNRAVQQNAAYTGALLQGGALAMSA